MPTEFEACNAILENTVLNTFIVSKSQSLDSNVISWIQRHSYEDFQRHKENGLKFGFSIPVKGVPIPFNLDSDMSKEDYQKLQEHINAGSVENISMNDTSNMVQQVVPPEIYHNWLQCMTSMINHQPFGFQEKVERNGDEIIITLSYRPVNNEKPKVQEFFFDSNIFECKLGLLKKGQEIVGEHTIVMKHLNPKLRGTLVISTDGPDIRIPLRTKLDDVIADSEKFGVNSARVKLAFEEISKTPEFKESLTRMIENEFESLFPEPIGSKINISIRQHNGETIILAQPFDVAYVNGVIKHVSLVTA
ncbi:hypothetical protein ACVNS2_16545 [Paenibacillus caseinilyticus]|uniref:hypothetical protein n=1 Tax=Paenibacillus mucilaginosus TaxID=61624 RepID=UPI000FFEEF53|nr:hypothetical protein [Paenibacillus mucilaginosus]